MARCTNYMDHSSSDNLLKGKLKDMEYICLQMDLTIQGILTIIVHKAKGFSGLSLYSMKEDLKRTNFMEKELKKVKSMNTLENFMRETELRALINGKWEKNMFSAVISTSQINFMAQVHQYITKEP
jgi:hypothetical protein